MEKIKLAPKQPSIAVENAKGELEIVPMNSHELWRLSNKFCPHGKSSWLFCEPCVAHNVKVA